MLVQQRRHPTDSGSHHHRQPLGSYRGLARETGVRPSLPSGDQRELSGAAPPGVDSGRCRDPHRQAGHPLLVELDRRRPPGQHLLPRDTSSPARCVVAPTPLTTTAWGTGAGLITDVLRTQVGSIRQVIRASAISARQRSRPNEQQTGTGLLHRPLTPVPAVPRDQVIATAHYERGVPPVHGERLAVTKRGDMTRRLLLSRRALTDRRTAGRKGCIHSDPGADGSPCAMADLLSTGGRDRSYACPAP